MADLEIEASPLYQINRDLLISNGGTKKIKVHEGGTGSGKTYAILQTLIFEIGFQEEGQIISIVRATLAEMRDTVMRDFFRILNDYGIYQELNHDKTNNKYNLNGNIFEFVGMDKAQKRKGARRDYLYINEAVGNQDSTGLKLEDWFQLSVRTRKDIFIDYNPSEIDHWVYSIVIPREDCELIKSTYLDGYDFLTKAEITEIEIWKPVYDSDKNLIRGDEYYWKVYGLGLRAAMRGLIFSNCGIVDAVPEEAKLLGYGLDFGFTNHPTALIAVYMQSGVLILDELIYQTGLTNPEIFEEAKRLSIKFNVDCFADSAEAKSIVELQRMEGRKWKGIKACKKGADSINQGIDILKRYPKDITKGSLNMQKEQRNYKWAQDSEGKPTNKAVDKYNHGWDAVRYVAVDKLGKPKAKPKRYTFKKK